MNSYTKIIILILILILIKIFSTNIDHFTDTPQFITTWNKTCTPTSTVKQTIGEPGTKRCGHNCPANFWDAKNNCGHKGSCVRVKCDNGLRHAKDGNCYLDTQNCVETPKVTLNPLYTPILTPPISTPDVENEYNLY